MSTAYTAEATAKGGRNGHVASSDGLVAFDLSIPKAIGGPGKDGATNPEQLFAAGYAACFGSAVDLAAKSEKVDATDATVTAEVTLAKNEEGFFLAAKLKVKIPSTDRATAQKIVEKAHQICPYSKATRNNIMVELEVL